MLEKTQAFGKGFKGFSKPYIDASVVFNALTGNETIVKNLRAYKHLSRSNAPEPKGLIQCLDLWKALVKVEKSGEIHSQPLRHALLSLLAEDPTLNTTKHSGQVWANLEVEKIGCLLAHIRNLVRDNCLTNCAARLTSEELTMLRSGLSMVELPWFLSRSPCLPK